MTGHRFEASDKAKLVGEERRRLQPAQAMIEFSAPAPNTVAADLGCGNGYVAVPLSDRVRRLLAVDAQKGMLQAIEGGAMDLIQADMEALPFKVGAFDHAFMVMVAHEFEDLGAVLRTIRDIVGPGGRLTIVEHQKKQTPIGPPLHERIDRAEVLIHCQGWKELRFLDAETYFQMELQAV